MASLDAAATVTDFARLQARVRPDAPAFWFDGRETSFGALDARSSQCAQALLAAGVVPGQRIAVLSKNTDAFPVLWFGTMKARACAVPVNTRLAPPEIAAILRDSGATHLLFGREFSELADHIAAECPALRHAVGVRVRVRRLDRGVSRDRSTAGGAAGRRRHPALHLRHHRTAEGRAADARQLLASVAPTRSATSRSGSRAGPRCWRCRCSISPARWWRCCPPCRGHAP